MMITIRATRESAPVRGYFPRSPRVFYADLTEKYRLISFDNLQIQAFQRSWEMDPLKTSGGFVRDPLAWAVDCSSRARAETEPEARDAYTQLAEEFVSVSTEMEGLISTFEALTKRRKNGQRTSD